MSGSSFARPWLPMPVSLSRDLEATAEELARYFSAGEVARIAELVRRLEAERDSRWPKPVWVDKEPKPPRGM